jgi:uncharacterized OB-fold protein
MSDILAILPTPTVDSEEFWRGCERGELLLRRCEECGTIAYYPRSHCISCGGERLAWQQSAGTGTIYSFTHVAVSFYGKAWESRLPYTVVLVDLVEGPRMLSRLVDAERARVRIGARVKLAFVSVEGRGLPFFQLAEEDDR